MTFQLNRNNILNVDVDCTIVEGHHADLEPCRKAPFPSHHQLFQLEKVLMDIAKEDKKAYFFVILLYLDHPNLFIFCLFIYFFVVVRNFEQDWVVNFCITQNSSWKSQESKRKVEFKLPRWLIYTYYIFDLTDGWLICSVIQYKIQRQIKIKDSKFTMIYDVGVSKTNSQWADAYLLIVD